MILISNNGNLYGPDRANEGTLKAIDIAICAGFDCKIEVFERNGRLFLYGKEPQERISTSWLYLNKDRLWIHCKNLKAFRFFSDNLKDHGFNYFCDAQNDIPIFTSKGDIWLNEGNVWDFGILNKPDRFRPNIKDVENAKGVCSDFIAAYVKKSL